MTKKLKGERIAKLDKRKRPRGPYRCARCRDYGHRADKCPNAHKAQVLLDSLPGEIALKSLVPEYFQIIAIVEGQTGAALVGAIKGNETLASRGMPHNNSMVNAWSELAVRAAKIPGVTIERARAARAKLLEAESEYNDAIAPIRLALGHKPPDQSWRHPLKGC